MAAGRRFMWQAADGNRLELQDYINGIQVLKGVTGLGKPQYQIDIESSPGLDQKLLRSTRAAGRQIFLPLQIWADSRQELISFKQFLSFLFDPSRGSGLLYVTDGVSSGTPGLTYKIRAIYSGGLEGDENEDVAGEEGLAQWQKTGILLDCLDPYFELTAASTATYGYSGSVPFFPILPLKLTPSQVLSDISQPAITNRLTNPSSETNTTSWSTVFFGELATTVTRQNLFSKYGSWGLRIDFPATTSSQSSTVFQQPAAALTSGSKYTDSIWVYVPSDQIAVRVRSWDGTSSPNTVFDDWQRISTSFTSSFSTIALLAVRRLNAGIVAQPASYCYIDGGMINEGNLTDYIDGDQANCHWSGTAHASTSYRDPEYAPTLITNTGTKDTYPLWKISGPGTQLTMWNRTTDKKLTLNRTLTASDVVTIDMKNKTITDQTGLNLFRYLADDDFWPLIPGDNYVTLALISAAAGSNIGGLWYPKMESLV